MEQGNTKPFYRYVKSLKNDNTGLSSLKKGTKLVTSAQHKADLLLEEFSSVFTKEDTESIPWLGPAKSKIDDITVTENGVRKLLKKLKPHKAKMPKFIVLTSVLQLSRVPE